MARSDPVTRITLSLTTISSLLFRRLRRGRPPVARGDPDGPVQVIVSRQRRRRRAPSRLWGPMARPWKTRTPMACNSSSSA